MRYFLFAVLIIAASCRQTKNSVAEIEKTLPEVGDVSTDYIQLSRYKCRGSCKVFDLTIYGDGRAFLDAKENLSLRGSYRLQVRPEEAVEILKAAEVMWTMGDTYYSRVSDYQKMSVTLNRGDRTKTVHGKTDAPESYVALFDRLEALIDRVGWKKVEGLAPAPHNE